MFANPYDNVLLAFVIHRENAHIYFLVDGSKNLERNQMELQFILTRLRFSKSRQISSRTSSINRTSFSILNNRRK